MGFDRFDCRRAGGYWRPSQTNGEEWAVETVEDARREEQGSGQEREWRVPGAGRRRVGVEVFSVRLRRSTAIDIALGDLCLGAVFWFWFWSGLVWSGYEFTSIG